MPLSNCRECSKEISTQAFACPHCGAPKPADHKWNGYGVDWKTKASLLGYPLVHIAFGYDKQRKRRVAKGIIAIGQFGIGLVTFAQFGVGFLFGFGQGMIGFIVIAQIAAGVMAVGQLAVAYYAFAQGAVAYYAFAQKAVAYYNVAQIDLPPVLGWLVTLFDPN